MNFFIEYLKDGCERLDFVKSISIIGSAYQKSRILLNDEIDLYVVLDFCSPQKINTVLALLENTKKLFGKIPYIETRRGPYRNKRELQLHVIIDDLSSIHQTSVITLADWANNSLLIKGVPVTNYVKKDFLNSSFKYEIKQTLKMLSFGIIKYKKWLISKENCCIVEEIQNIVNLNEYCELLKYSYKAMKNDFTALMNLSNASAPEEKQLEKFIDDYKNGNIININLQQMQRKIVGWNFDLFRASC